MKKFLQNYLNVSFSKKLKNLFLSALFRHIGLSLVGTFGVIFFYEIFNNSLEKVIYMEIILFSIFLLTIPLIARLYKKFALEKLMKFSIPFLALAMLFLYLLDKTQLSAFIGLYIVAISIFRVFYWVPYHIEVAESTDDKTRGKQIAIMTNIAVFFSVFIPILSGFIITKFGFSPVFIMATLVALLSIIPLHKLDFTFEEYSFSYIETFKKLFSKELRPLFLAHFSAGVQSSIAVTIWPIYIFLLFDGEYTTLGIITSLSVLTLVILRIVVGYFSDKGKKSFILKYSSILSASGWIFKIFAGTPMEVFAIDSYHNVGRVSQGQAYSHTMYEHASNNNDFIDEYTVLRELALNSGRIFMFIFALILLNFFSMEITFIMAALATLLISLESKEKKLSK